MSFSHGFYLSWNGVGWSSRAGWPGVPSCRTGGSRTGELPPSSTFQTGREFQSFGYQAAGWNQQTGSLQDWLLEKENVLSDQTIFQELKL